MTTRKKFHVYVCFCRLFVQEFHHPEDAEDAVYEMNGKRFMGSTLLVELRRGVGYDDSDSYLQIGPCYNCGQRGHVYVDDCACDFSSCCCFFQ